MAVVGGVPFQNLEMRKARPLWTKATDPVLNILPSIARHAGQAWESMGIAEPSPLDEHPSAPPGYRAARTIGKNLLGGFGFLMSPFSGPLESLWDRPVSENIQEYGGVPKKYADPLAVTLSGLAPVIGVGAQLGKLAGQVPRTIRQVQQTLQHRPDKVFKKEQWGTLTSDQKKKMGASERIAPGTNVFVRLHLKAKPKKQYRRSPDARKKEPGKTSTDYLLTVHREQAGEAAHKATPLAYDQAVHLKNGRYSIDQESRTQIRQQEVPKHPAMSVGGEFQDTSYASMQRFIDNADDVATMDPNRANLAFNRATGQAVESFDDAVLVGNNIYLKNPKYWNREDLSAEMERGILPLRDMPLNWEGQLWDREARIVTNAIKRNPQHLNQLLDKRRLGTPPDVEFGGSGHWPLVRRPVSAETEEKWNRIFTPEKYRETIKHVDLGLKEGGFEWWDLEPLRYRFIDYLGPKEGNAWFLDFIQSVAALSPGSEVPLNIRRAAYFYHILRNAKSPNAAGRQVLDPFRAIQLFDQGLPTGLGHYMPITHKSGLERAFVGKTKAGKRDVGYGAPDPARLGLFSAQSSKEIPKVSSMAWNLRGNLAPSTTDVHIMDLMTGKAYHQFDKRKGKMTGASPEANLYALPEEAMIDIARKKGVLPAQAQAAGWGSWRQRERGLGESEPFLIMFERIIKDTAQKRNLTPDQVLEKWIKGKIPLASVLPMGGTQLGTELADDIFGEKLIG